MWIKQVQILLPCEVRKSINYSKSKPRQWKLSCGLLLSYAQISKKITVLNILTPTSPSISNVHNLAMFICHLFIDGNFRYCHILYDPKVFDNQLTNQIDSICLVQIPWLTSDITQGSLSPWQANERTDPVLQLIFFDPKYSTEQNNKFSEYLSLNQWRNQCERAKGFSRGIQPHFQFKPVDCAV